MKINSSGKYWDQGWNPIVGCRKVSPGCDNCYAMANAWRIGRHPNPKIAGRYQAVLDEEGWWSGEVEFLESVLSVPPKRKKPTIYFNSMSDPFRRAVPDEWLDQMFAVMALCPQHTFLLCTKRPERMREYLNASTIAEKVKKWPLPNVWLGVTAENQEMADKRIPILLNTPAAIRYVSVEPCLGPVGLADVSPLDWVVVGGETGAEARPMHPDWARSLRDQCQEAGVPFFFKQWGEWKQCQEPQEVYSAKTGFQTLVAGEGFKRVGKKAAGRILDGKEYNEMPTIKETFYAS